MDDDDINYQWLDYKIDTNHKDLMLMMVKLEKEVKKLEKSVDKLKESKNILDEIKIDIMDLEN
tara:strand:+ start:81 stop:269 length:189 start_codon:yes stop_codon:yes gene_type:complete